MIQADEKNSRSPADPGTSKIQTKESSSFSAGSITSLSEMEKTMSPTQVASYEYMGTTYYRHEGFDVKPRARTNDEAGIKLLSQGGVAYRSHRTPANFRGRGDSWSGGGRGGAFWPRKSLLSSFGEADLTHNFKIQQSLAMRRNSCDDAKSDYHNNGPLYTKSGQPYVPISVANTKWYRTRLASEENRETRKEPICHRGKGSYQDSLIEESGGKSKELANDESNDMMERLLDRDNEFKVEAIEDLSVKDLKCLKLTATSAKALIRIFEPMLKNWKEVVSVVPDTSDEKNVNEDIKENAATSETTFVLRPECKESTKSVEIVPGNENESIILEEMSQKLLGNSTPVPPRIPLPKHQKDISNAKNLEIKEELQRKETSVREDVAYANSYSPATGLRMIEASSAVRNYVFTIGDRGEISRVLTPLVKELVVINKIGGKGKECKLEIGVVVESQQQFFGAIKDVHISFKSKGFQFKPLENMVNGRSDVLNELVSHKVIPKVDCNGMYQITVKFNLPKGREKKVDESLGEELVKEVEGCRVEKISFGPGERILQLGHVKDMIKASKKIKNLFDIIPSKHIWNNEHDKVRNGKERKKRQNLRTNETKAKIKEQSNRNEEKAQVKEQSNGKERKGKNKEQSTRKEDKSKNIERSNRKEEKAKNKELSNRKDEKAKNKERSNRKDEKAKNKEHSRGKEAKVKNKEQSNKVELDIADDPNPNTMIRQEKEKSVPVLSNQCVTVTLSDSDSACDPSKMQLKSSALRSPPPGDSLDGRSEVKTSPLSSLIRLMEGGEKNSDLKLLQDSFVKCPNDNEENENQVFDMLEKVMAAGHDVDGEKQKKAMAAGYNNGKKLENGMAVRNGDNDKMLKKTINTGDANQNIQLQDIRKENFQSEKEVCQLGEENKLIFQSIDESKIDIVKEDTSWYGNVSDFVTIKNNFSLWNVYVIFEAKEATKIAYFGLREKYNGVRAGCEIDI